MKVDNNGYINDYSDLTRIEISLKIYVELLRSASDKGALLETNIDKNIALIAFKFTDTFIEGSKSLWKTTTHFMSI